MSDEIVLPIAREAERNLLGLLFLDETALPKALDAGVTPDLFGVHSHQLVYRAMQDCQTKGWALHPDVLVDYLKQQHQLDRVGGVAFVASLIDGSVARAQSIPGLVRQLQDFRYKREATRKAVELQRAASNGASPEEIEQLLESMPRAHTEVQSYAETVSGLVYRKPSKQGFGFDSELLTNFTARITAELTEDDGAGSEEKFFDLEVKIKGQTRTLNVAAKKFGAMSWPLEMLGADAIIEPQRAEKAKVAILRLSRSIQKRTVYTHTGWRQIDGAWCYLHSGGAITPQGNRTDVAVKLSKALQHYCLPEPPKDTSAHAHAYQAAFAFLAAVPLPISVPLLGSVWASVLGDPDYSLYVVGESGSFKSELTALTQSFFGPEFRRLTLPANWNDTARSLEMKPFYAKDALLVIDDFAPNGNKKHDDELHNKAEIVLRAAGNRAGRGTLNADRTERAAKEPRGLLLSSGEDVPRGMSLQARLVIVPIKRGEISKENLSDLQARATQGAFALCLATFLRDLARDYESLRNSFRAECVTRREEFAEQMSGHARQPTAIAHLASAWAIFLEQALLAGALNQTQHSELWRKILDALNASGEAQKEQHSSLHPAEYFLELVRSVLLSGKGHLLTVDGECPTNARQWGWRSASVTTENVSNTTGELQTVMRMRNEAGGEHIGWIEETTGIVYLEPTSAYNTANRQAIGQGETLPCGKMTLWKRLDEKGWMVEKTAGKGNRYWLSKVKANTIAIKSEILFCEIQSGS